MGEKSCCLGEAEQETEQKKIRTEHQGGEGERNRGETEHTKEEVSK